MSSNGIDSRPSAQTPALSGESDQMDRDTGNGGASAILPAQRITASLQTIALSAEYQEALRLSLHDIGSPYENLEDFLISVYTVFAGLPREILERIFEFRNDPSQYGALHLAGFPGDEDLPRTPLDGKRSREKKTFVSEACALGISRLVGEPIGYYAEKEGEIIHNLCPVKSEAQANSSESSQINLGFHTDFNFDKECPNLPYNVVNPDYVVLVCLRADKNRQARTMYADARDLCGKLNEDELLLLRQPLFQFAASYSFTGKCGADRVWSIPSPVIQGLDKYPEISIDLLCGIRALTDEANRVLTKTRSLCDLADVAGGVRLSPGDMLLMDNRKGAHSRSAFEASFDGYDRWVQRVYVRRSLWELRKAGNSSLRVF